MRLGSRRFVLISAISARANVATDYALSKLAGENALRRSDIGWDDPAPVIGLRRWQLWRGPR